MAVAKGKACTATFHLYPHNITANLGMGKENFVNDLIMRWWKRIVYDYCSDIQCPTAEVARYLQEKDIHSRLHFAGNGTRGPKYKRMGKRLVEEGVLRYEPVFGFYSADQLRELTRR